MTESTGGCFCGAVRYRATKAPVRVSACACEWCRRRTGSVLGLSVYFREDNCTVYAEPGSLSTYRLTSDAGRWIETGFCATCGTTVFWHLEFLPGRIGIAGGTFDDPARLGRPERLVFARSRPCWLSLDQAIPTFDTMP